MDARTTRTAQALHRAVMGLASERPIDDVTVVELTAAAGVSRRTLYNHAPSPQRLLVSILQSRLDEVYDAFRAEIIEGAPLGEAWARGELRVGEHLRDFGDVYAAGIDGPADHMSPSLARMLGSTFERQVLEILQENSPLSSEQMFMTARFIGHGLVGAIEAWLMTGERSPQVFVANALRSIPSWVSGVET